MTHSVFKKNVIAACAAAAVGAPAFAQEALPQEPADAASGAVQRLERVRVTGTASTLDKPAPTASRLGLSARETPAAIDVIDAKTIETRGYQTVEQAVDSLPGVTSGGAPGSPSQFSMRGFTGDQITILRDGLYIGPADMTYRPQNSFNLSGIDVLKGPGSVLYGQGSVAGTVNVLTKKPVLGVNSYDAVATFGRFDTTQLGVGGNFVLAPDAALRVDASRTSSSGFVEHSRSNSGNLTMALLWKPSTQFDAQASVDILHDNPTPYWGTPLVPTSFATEPLTGVLSSTKGLTLDKRMRYVNYDVTDYQITSTQYTPRLTLHWKPMDDLVITNDSYYLYASRHWKNSEAYSFNPTTNLVDRDRFFVFHDQHLYGNQLSGAYSHPIGDLANRFVLGLDYSKLNFVRSRGFPDGESVDPFNPAPGTFGPIVPRVSPTKWTDTAVFAEDALDVTHDLKLVTGARYESFKLDRKNFGADGSYQPATSFTRTFKPFNWRVGAIYQATPDISPYIQYSTGQDPVGSNILLVNAGQNFDLSRSRQAEAGVKASFDDKRGDATFAVYDIDRKNLLTQTSPDTVANVGSQKSRGIELTVDYRPMSVWHVNANTAYTDARYGSFVDPNFGVDASGNRPANIPRWTANLWNSYSGFGGVPLEIGAGVRYVGQRFGDTANSLRLDSYTVVDTYATYAVNKTFSVTGRIFNLFNKAYAQWADVNYPTQVQLASPISYEIGIAARF